MIDISQLSQINPYVRMMKLQKEMSFSGKWEDVDNVFTYIAVGNADFIVNGISYHLHTGSIIIIPPYMTHVIISNSTEPFIQYIMHFDFYETEQRKELVHKNMLEEEQPVIPEAECVLDDRVIVSEIPEAENNQIVIRFLNLLQEFNAERPGKELMMKAGCMELLVSALRNQVELAEKSSRKKTKSWIHIENAIEYIMNCGLTGDLTNERVAAAIGVSANYLTSIFQMYLGISLHKYIVNVRIKHAQRLLLSGRVNVTEAADRTGFSSIHVFSKTFKSIMGISPSQFINEIATKKKEVTIYVD
ncbi:MAG: AraC family transcriptional regulator [Clostridium sp.]|nr:AraC family transcriptional regulator [Clostridium sp.]